MLKKNAVGLGFHTFLIVSLLGCGSHDDAPDGVDTSPVAEPVVSLAHTANPLVASLTVSAAPVGSKISGQFGPNTSYTRSTSETSVDGSGAATILVAGMEQGSTYYVRARITGPDGSVRYSPDSIFVTGAVPADLAALQLTTGTAAGRVPSPGVEMIETASGPGYPHAVDLNGKLIWYYTWPDYDKSVSIGGMRQMPNGNFVAPFASRSDQPVSGIVDRDKGRVREFDLAGNTVRQITVAQVNAKLAAKGYGPTLDQFHHHVEILPNGHWIVLSNTSKIIDSDRVVGDVIVDLDQHLDPVFVWNAFDHLDVARRPFDRADWTHANAVVYSPTDGNLLISLRHQHWVLKINYRDGAGDGAVIWRLGAGGDFTLVNGSDPSDWQYAQHYPFFTDMTTAGSFDVLLMDNGNMRPLPDGTACGTPAHLPCYTTIPEFHVDEQLRTVAVKARVTLPASLYSFFGGNAERLGNGNVEYTLSGAQGGSLIQEVQDNASHTLVWSLVAPRDVLLYRGYRLPSLYPGVTWRTPGS